MAGVCEPTHYEVLRIEPDAGDKVVKKAYRKLAVAHHPDKDHSDGAVERFQRIQHAYDVLSDPVQRRRYDDALAGGGEAGEAEANPDRASPLMTAAARGDVAEVSKLFRAQPPPNPDEMDAFDRTALMYAAAAAQPEAVELLLAARADVGCRDSEGMPPLVFAAGGKRGILELSPGTIKCLRLLLDGHADVNSYSARGLSALSLACKAGSPTVTSFLLERSAAPDQEVDSGNSLTPLACAAHRGHVKIVDLLLKGRANPNNMDSDGETALMAASGAGHEAVVEMLLNSGSDVRVCMQDGGTALLCAVEEYADRRMAQGVAEAVVRRLLAMSADPIASTVDGRTPLKTAARNKGDSWLEELLGTAAATQRKNSASCKDCIAGFKIMFGQ